MSKIEALKLDAAELYRLSELTERRRVKDILVIEAKKIETEVSKLQETESIIKPNPGVQTPSTKRTYDVKLNTYAWDQNDSTVKVFVTLPNVQSLPAENIKCTFTQSSFELQVRELEGKNYFLTIKNLHSSINPNKCSWKVKTGMVVLTLSKNNSNHWTDLVKVEKEAKKQPKMSEDADPSAGIMNLMKQMYEEGDDEMKRTIAKAWTESREKNSMMDF